MGVQLKIQNPKNISVFIHTDERKITLTYPKDKFYLFYGIKILTNLKTTLSEDDITEKAETVMSFKTGHMLEKIKERIEKICHENELTFSSDIHFGFFR